MILYSISSVTNKQTNQQNLETPNSWSFFASQHGEYHYTWPSFFFYILSSMGTLYAGWTAFAFGWSRSGLKIDRKSVTRMQKVIGKGMKGQERNVQSGKHKLTYNPPLTFFHLQSLCVQYTVADFLLSEDCFNFTRLRHINDSLSLTPDRSIGLPIKSYKNPSL